MQAIPQATRDKLAARHPHLSALCRSDDPRAARTLALNATNLVTPSLTLPEVLAIARVSRGGEWEG